ncbi:MAG: hypothetical protein HOI23_10450 [Deltaproteobacteria bacterium]|jgi:hypothetical protein|nr:hypothetical protein [Deltaproteobacteria bacterium]MBT6433340.1 hypothetical protein [Deltaproteobacteria bacterium]MBT6490029.1 hypothetical protein [Deltaproteobacteria bacterium]
MSRVKDNRDAERIQEQKRLEKDNQAKDRQKSDKFSRMMNQRRGGEQKGPTHQTARQPAQTPQKAKTGASNALMARQGIASNRFAAALQKQGSENLQHSETLSTDRGGEMLEKRVETAEHQDTKETQRLDGQQDRVEAVDRDDGKGKGQSGKGDGDGSQGGGSGQEKRDGQGQNQGQPTAVAALSGEAPAGEVNASNQPQIPQNILQEIVNRVFVGASTEGLTQFHVEFKEEVLGGLRLEISAKDGKISAKFITSDKNIGRLLKASEGQLSRAFGHKGMSLERLDVETR